MIAKGSSYSFSYLVRTIAMSKYFTEQGYKVIVAGLSQGGYAALINSLYYDAVGAVVSSGYSVLYDSMYIAGFDQLVLPNSQKYFSVNKIKKRIHETPTHYLFTYGTNEEDIYNIEVLYNNSQSTLVDEDKITFKVFKGSHEFPVKEIVKWINQLPK